MASMVSSYLFYFHYVCILCISIVGADSYNCLWLKLAHVVTLMFHFGGDYM